MTASLVLICGGGSGAAWGASPTFARTSRAAISLVLIRGRADSGCSTGSTLAGDSWTAASRVLIRGGSAPSRGAGAVSPWLPRTVDSRILIRCRSDPAAGVDSGLTPSEGAAPPSLAVTTSLVLIRGGSWEGGSEGGSWGLFLLQQRFHPAPRLIGPTGGSVLDPVAAVVAGLPTLGSLPELAPQALRSVIQPTADKFLGG